MRAYSVHPMSIREQSDGQARSPTASITLSSSASAMERPMGWPDLHWKHDKRSHKAYSRYWKRGRSPVATIPRHPKLRGDQPRLGRRSPSFAAHFPYIMLSARAAMIMAAGVSEREAMQMAMLEFDWQPNTCSEIDRVRMVLRRTLSDGHRSVPRVLVT